MAKSTTAKTPKKKKKAASTKGVKVKVKLDSGKKGAKKSKLKGDGKGFEALIKLADHPIISDLLAVGAMAAVAAIAERPSGKGKNPGSSQAVKAAGKAAAAAIGKRLIAEFEAVKTASKSKSAPKA